ncbi:MAG: hypothetical protein ACRD4F_09595 [Candidatus Angelobacter sp.]
MLAAERAWASGGFAADDAAIEQSENKAAFVFLPHIVSMLSSEKPYLRKDPSTHAKTFPEPAHMTRGPSIGHGLRSAIMALLQMRRPRMDYSHALPPSSLMQTAPASSFQNKAN